MSSLITVVDDHGGSRGLDAAWDHVASRGGEVRIRTAHDGGAMGVARRRWQQQVDLAGHHLIVEEDGVQVAADATLYDRPRLYADLEARGQPPRGDDPAHAIAAAWRAWGPALVDHLVGDYAFVVRDTRSGRVMAARDPTGSRPLYYARRGRGFAVASSSRALALWRGTPSQLNVACLGAQVAGTLLSMGTETAYAGVEVLRPGFSILYQEGRVAVRRFFSPPRAPDPDPVPLDEAAAAFGELLRTVVRDRMGSCTPTTVWMSGGWDSTAVFGAGRAVLADGPHGDRDLRPVSIRYPPDDPGHEDPWIEATADRWGVAVEWLDSEEIPLFAGLARRAAASDEPPSHMYERWNAALARGTRRVGSRIALDGCGGDNLFQVSDVVMADALRRGRIGAAARMARARRPMGWRHLVRHALVPSLPGGVLAALERMSGRNVPRHHMELGRVPWVPDAFVRRHRLRERDLAVLADVPAETLAQAENVLLVSLPALAWGGTYVRQALLEEGVEARSPLLDTRIVDFALRRPVSDRVGEAETKMLLRRAVRGWVPDEVLAPRRRRTGVTSSYSRRRGRAELPRLLDRLLAEPLRTADLGIVDPTVLRDAVEDWRGGRHAGLTAELFGILAVEFWLRGRVDGES